jgi:uncharacterized RDD family membrane protein YckC
MKCPKCGFTSFDFLESCKKCGVDLQNHKSQFGLRSLLFPGFKSTEPAPSLLNEAGDDFAASAGETTESADFGFDFMSDDEPATTEEPILDDASLPEDGPSFDFDEESFIEEPLLDEDDDFWDADAESATESDPNAGTTAAAPDEEVEIDLDDWESDLEEEASPPQKKEGPSDPFEARESADSDQASEEITPAVNLAAVNAVTMAAANTLGTEAANDPAQTRLFPDFELGPADEPGLFSATAIREPAAAEEESWPENSTTSTGLHGDFTATADFPEEVVPLPALSARIYACLTDLLILASIFVLFLVVGEMAVPDPDGHRLFPTLTTLLAQAVPYFLVLFALCFGYFTLFHFLLGQTPGKMVFNLRIESITGEPLLFSQAFLRSAGGLFSLLAGGIGYLTAAFNSKGRGWNDLLAGSRMVPLFADEIKNDDLAPLEI